MIILFNDMRIIRTVESLIKQNRKPDKILIADGGSPDEFISHIKNYMKDYKIVEIVKLPGRCIDTRRQVIEKLLKKSEIIVFIDSDESAPSTWLEKIVAPIEQQKADFTGGPTKERYEAKSKPEQIVNIMQKQGYELAQEDVSYIAMGNSAWNIKIFETIGTFDSSSISEKTDKDVVRGMVGGSYHVSDDVDINIRAMNAGFKGLFINDAYVYHDQSHINTYRKLLRYQYMQAVRGAMAYFKHKSSINKFVKGSRKVKITHPFQIVLIMIKPVALLRGWIEWNKCKG